MELKVLLFHAAAGGIIKAPLVIVPESYLVISFQVRSDRGEIEAANPLGNGMFVYSKKAKLYGWLAV